MPTPSPILSPPLTRNLYRWNPSMSTPLGDHSTTVQISNLHCSSCVTTIEECLSTLSPPPLSTQVSIVLQSVTVHHLEELSPQAIRLAILDAGFDVESNSPSASHSRQQKHIQQCLRCQKDLQDPPVSHHPEKGTGSFKATFSVGGMTCSSCSNTITDVVSQMSGVSDIVVSLLDGSATAIVDSKGMAEAVREAIDDCGFEARTVSVNLVHPRDYVEVEDTSRVISLRVDGMFCQHCPKKVMLALEPFGDQIQIVKPLSTHTDSVLTISYQPAPPSFSIRTIISAITSSSSPSFGVSVYHPPTLEELSRALRLRERRDIMFRLIFAVIAAIPTFIIGIVYMTLVKGGNPVKEYLMEPIWAGNASRSEWALLFIATPVMFYSANHYHRRSIKEIRALWRRGSATPIWRRFVRFGSMNLLVSAGVSVAYFSSIGLLGLAATSPRHTMTEATTYFDAVIFLTMFLLAGRYLEAYSKSRTADAVTALSSLRPGDALLVVPQRFQGQPTLSWGSGDLEKGGSDEAFISALPGSTTERIPVDLLEVGDIVVVPSGSTPPADGTIIEGEQSAFDESSLTGESRLIKKKGGNQVFLGTINKGQMVHIKVDAIGGGTMLDNIVKVVREGQTRRAPIERVADIITGYFVPVVTLLAILTWIIWLALGVSGVLPPDYLDIQIGGWPVWSLQFAIAVFVVACPCGIGLAAPTALLVGMGLAANFGILARGGGEAFQEMSQLDLVVFDKTGTLTEGGEPRVSDVEFSPHIRWSQETIRGIATEVESASSHPLAIAIRNFCKEKSPQQAGSDIEETAGRGLKASFQGLRCTAIIGNELWMQEHGAVLSEDSSRHIERWKTEAKSVVLLAIRDESDSPASAGHFEIVAVFGVSDSVRSEASEVISWFQAQGIRTWMISGDNITTASAVAAAVGIPSTNVIAGVLPHEKSQKIQWLQRTGTKRDKSKTNGRTIVAMVGDGINDAPALTAADVGIAIGSGSDVAISSASFVLLSSNLRSLATLHDLSRRVINRVKFNFLWACLYNLAALPVAAGVIYPAGHVRLNPVWASLAMALSSVSVVCSSLLLKTYKEPIALPKTGKTRKQ